MNLTEALKAISELTKENADLQAMSQASAENRRILAKAALDHVSGKIDAMDLVELAKGMLV